MRSIPVPCGSSSRGCVRSRWPDPKGQRRWWTLFISLSKLNNLPEPSGIMKDTNTISISNRPYTIPNVSIHIEQTVDGHQEGLHTMSTAGHRYRKCRGHVVLHETQRNDFFKSMHF